jgi:AhpD family alkylhydroperoxidase
MNKDYPEYHRHLGRLIKELRDEVPAAMRGFSEMHSGALADGALSTQTKELMALAISIAVRCDGCIAYHVHDALKAGATGEEITETIGVAILMGGGPALIYGAEALEALQQFQSSTTEVRPSNKESFPPMMTSNPIG